MRRLISVITACVAVTSAFHHPHHQASLVVTRNNKVSTRQRYSVRSYPLPVLLLKASTSSSAANDDDADGKSYSCWNPRLRKIMGAIAGTGVLETAYLTYTEVSGQTAFCPSASTASSSCSSVLTGPYAHIPGSDIPLAALGLVAYSTALGLAIGPLMIQLRQKVTNDHDDDNDSLNRVALTAVTTTMGVFSAFLMSFLFGVLHEFCAYCVASAVFSIVLAKLTWIGGALPKNHTKEGVTASIGGSVLSLLAAIFLFTSNDLPVNAAVNVAAGELVAGGGQSTTTLIAENKQQLKAKSSPPPITTDSSQQAMMLASDLESLNTRFFGAFWCSHCYDQKQTMGKQAMNKIPYVECSRDGVDAQVDLCKSRKVPGYPTWEIDGKLYPGEQALEELEEIVAKAKASKSSASS